MRFVIVTGMSGAGKSTAMKMLEDFGYFCVDNLPIALIKKFADLSFDSKGKIDKVALGVDIRSGNVNDLYVNESNETVVELGDPIYFTLYDIANATV